MWADSIDQEWDDGRPNGNQRYRLLDMKITEVTGDLIIGVDILIADGKVANSEGYFEGECRLCATNGRARFHLNKNIPCPRLR